MSEEETYLRRPEAAAYLRQRYGFGSWRSLAKKACRGGGPKYFRLGAVVLYRREDLDAWVASRLIPAGETEARAA